MEPPAPPPPGIQPPHQPEPVPLQVAENNVVSGSGSPGSPRARTEGAGRGWILSSVLLLATLTTTLIQGIGFEASVRGIPIPSMGYVWDNPRLLMLGLPYSISLLLILGCHEMGHYFACLRYKVAATPPYFLPSPFLIGTFGAFIRIKEPIRDRRALFDIGVAGPVAGFIVAVPVLIVGVATSGWVPEFSDGSVGFMLGDCLATMALISTVAPPPPVGDGFVFAFGGMAMAGWVGLLATAMNLLPVGQLDGGHMAYAISPRLHLWTSRLSFAAFLLLGLLVHEVWLFWATLLILFNPRHPRLVEEQRPLSARRLALAALGAGIFIISFIPSPLRFVIN